MTSLRPSSLVLLATLGCARAMESDADEPIEVPPPPAADRPARTESARDAVAAGPDGGADVSRPVDTSALDARLPADAGVADAEPAVPPEAPVGRVQRLFDL